MGLSSTYPLPSNNPFEPLSGGLGGRGGIVGHARVLLSGTLGAGRDPEASGLFGSPGSDSTRYPVSAT